MSLRRRSKTSSTPQSLAARLIAVRLVKRERAVDSFASFARQAWAILEPGNKLIWTWYLQVLCDALERQIRGEPEYRKLLIEIPPGTGKSTFVNVLAPAWEWLHNPRRRKLCLSNDDRLAERDSRKQREITRTDWYAELIKLAAERDSREPWTISRDQSEKINFENTERGFRQSFSLRAKLTGKRASDLNIDDPADAKEVILGSPEQVAKRLGEINDIIEKTLPTRVNQMETARWTLIMQRLHDDDAAARARAEGDWKVISIQMEYEPDNPDNLKEDPRTVEGELLDEKLFPRKEIDKIKLKLGDEYFAQYQQRPRPRGGGMFKKWYWCFWYPAGIAPPPPERVRKPDGTIHTCEQDELPEDLSQHTESWDCAFKGTKDSAFVVGQVWASLGARAYLLDQVREQLDINGTIDAIRALSRTWPAAIEKLVEDKANGPAVMGMLKKEIVGLVEFTPKGGKEERANAVAPLARAGNIWLPHPVIFPWVRGFLSETKSFPSSAYKDQVDAMTQFLLHWQGEDSWFI